MNKCILMGRLTKDPVTSITNGQNPVTAARYTLAVDRRRGRSQNQDQTADFISVVAYGARGDFAAKYFKKGMRVLLCGRIHTYSFLDNEGNTVYRTDVIADDQEFADSKRDEGSPLPAPRNDGGARMSQDEDPIDDGFTSMLPDDDEGLPFN